MQTQRHSKRLLAVFVCVLGSLYFQTFFRSDALQGKELTVKEQLDRLMTDKSKHLPALGKMAETYAGLILHKGKIIFEYYAPGVNSQSKLLSWSMSKAFVHALAGIAIQEGRLTLGTRVCDRVPHTPCDITVKDLLHWSSGLDWNETYEGADLSTSSVVQYLYGDGTRNGIGFVTEHSLAHKAGSYWSYSSGDSNLLMASISNSYPEREREDLPWKKLFDPLGIKNVTWERDSSNHFVGSSYLYISAKDLATFGDMMLRSGRHDDKTIIPQSWIDQSMKLSPAFLTSGKPDKDWDIPGMHWWLNIGVPEFGFKSPWPEISEKSYSARGHWGQYLVVAPDLDLVIVRFGLNRGPDTRFDIRGYLKLAAELARQQ